MQRFRLVQCFLIISRLNIVGPCCWKHFPFRIRNIPSAPKNNKKTKTKQKTRELREMMFVSIILLGMYLKAWIPWKEKNSCWQVWRVNKKLFLKSQLRAVGLHFLPDEIVIECGSQTVSFQGSEAGTELHPTFLENTFLELRGGTTAKSRTTSQVTFWLSLAIRHR